MSPTLLEVLVILLLLGLIAAYVWTFAWSLRQQRSRTAQDDQAPGQSQGDYEHVD